MVVRARPPPPARPPPRLPPPSQEYSRLGSRAGRGAEQSRPALSLVQPAPGSANTTSHTILLRLDNNDSQPSHTDPNSGKVQTEKVMRENGNDEGSDFDADEKCAVSKVAGTETLTEVDLMNNCNNVTKARGKLSFTTTVRLSQDIESAESAEETETIDSPDIKVVIDLTRRDSSHCGQRNTNSISNSCDSLNSREDSQQNLQQSGANEVITSKADSEKIEKQLQDEKCEESEEARQAENEDWEASDIVPEIRDRCKDVKQILSRILDTNAEEDEEEEAEDDAQEEEEEDEEDVEKDDMKEDEGEKMKGKGECLTGLEEENIADLTLEQLREIIKAEEEQNERLKCEFEEQKAEEGRRPRVESGSPRVGDKEKAVVAERGLAGAVKVPVDPVRRRGGPVSRREEQLARTAQFLAGPEPGQGLELPVRLRGPREKVEPVPAPVSPVPAQSTGCALILSLSCLPALFLILLALLFARVVWCWL